MKRCLVILWCVLGAGLVFGEESAVEGTAQYGISGALWLPGDLNAEDAGEVLKKTWGTVLRGMVDYFVTDRFSFGAYANLAPVSLEGSSTAYLMWEFGSTVKVRLPIPHSTFTAYPGIGLGYREVEIGSAVDSDIAMSGLAVNLDTQFVYELEDSRPFLDVGFFSQPYGGIQGYSHISWKPILYLGAGFFLK